ncbi:AMP-binding protein, partial [Staphylococcus aureus]
ARMICSGVRRGDVVGVCLPRSIDEVVARLAVMQAGAAFLPLDPDWPAERITNVLRHAGATLLLANASVFEAAKAAGSGLLDPSAEEAAPLPV